MMVEISLRGISKPIRCSPQHRFRDVAGSFVLAGDLVGGEPLEHSKLGTVVVKSVTPIPGEVELFDILDAGEENVFYSDNLVSHNCEFIGSSDTLLSVDKLNSMPRRSPIGKKKLRFDEEYRLDIHEHPQKNRIYILSADVSGGVEQDFSALTVTDITSVPYRVVSKYRSDRIRPMLFADVIYEVATFYNNAFVLIEVNDLGAETAKTLHQDLEYEYMIMTVTKGKSGPQVGGGFGKNSEFGLRNNRGSKRQGCTNLKTMIETDKLMVEDLEIFQEFTQFALNTKGSYSAEAGGHDDLVMTLVNFAWLVTQTYFKDLTNTDIYKKLKEDYNDMLENDVPLFGFITRGGDSFEDDDGLRL